MAKKMPTLLYEDSDLIVANKPAGLLSIPDRFVPEKPNLQHMLNHAFEKVWVVHRLDRDTSGLICFALNESAHRHLSLQFQERTVQKTYLAIVNGVVHKDQGTIDRAIAPHPAQSGKMMAGSKGKKAITHYKVVERFRQFTLLELELETGRTHQIRVHLEALGHPLIVDELYGRRAAFFLSEVKQRGFNLAQGKEERPLLTRQPLHALRLNLLHPASEQPLTLEAPLPKDMNAVVKQLKKWGV
jgi:23S rRNA pseudouridine955/2504/2580 synthase/23S rRNA pseudouridine1911/1915/1917 synthase